MFGNHPDPADGGNTAYCISGDGNPAIGEQLWGLSSDGTEIVELVCAECLGVA